MRPHALASLSVAGRMAMSISHLVRIRQSISDDTLRSFGRGTGALRHADGVAAQCPLWVKSGHLQCTSPCPLYPQKRPQKRTLGIARARQHPLLNGETLLPYGVRGWQPLTVPPSHLQTGLG